MTYEIAQSGDATCNGLTSTTEGSKTMKLTTSKTILIKYLFVYVNIEIVNVFFCFSSG